MRLLFLCTSFRLHSASCCCTFPYLDPFPIQLFFKTRCLLQPQQLPSRRSPPAQLLRELGATRPLGRSLLLNFSSSLESQEFLPFGRILDSDIFSRLPPTLPIDLNLQVLTFQHLLCKLSLLSIQSGVTSGVRQFSRRARQSCRRNGRRPTPTTLKLRVRPFLKVG